MLAQQSTTSEFMTPADVAKKLGYADRRPVYRAIEERRLHAIRLVENGPWRIPKQAWDRFVKADKR